MSPATAKQVREQREAEVAAVCKLPVPVVHVLSEIQSLGDGSYRLMPRKPRVEVEEISTVQACKILGISRGTIWYDRNTPLGQKILRWRFTGPGQGRIVWELPSVLAYKEALKQLAH